MINFADLKKKRTSDYERVNAKLKNISNPSFKDPDEEKYWQPVVDKNGYGFALLRLMPTPSVDSDTHGEDALPIVQWWSHGFEGPAGWYIEKSLTSLGKPDPCAEMNSKLWNSGDEAQKAFVQGEQKVKAKGKPGSKRKENFVCNVLVLKHPGRPDDEGKIFPYKFGKMIFGKINEAQNPKNPMDTPFNPFDLWEGANFALVIGKNDGGHRTYNDSKFMGPPGPLYVVMTTDQSGKEIPTSDPDNDKMEAAWLRCQSLQAFVAPEKFKTYDQLKARLDKIMGQPVTKSVESKPVITTKPAVAEVVETHKDNPPWEAETTDDDDAELAEFRDILSKAQAH